MVGTKAPVLSGAEQEPAAAYSQPNLRAKAVRRRNVQMGKWIRNGVPKGNFQARHFPWNRRGKYLLDGRLEISNNRAERRIKSFFIDRKNLLFANASGGAQGSAVIFSLIQTAIENGLDPWRYLTGLIALAVSDDIAAESFFPWASPDSYRISA